MSSWPWLLLTVGCLLPGALGQVFVGSNGTSTPLEMPAAGHLSEVCNATFSTRVTCEPTLLGIAYDGYFPTTKDLTSLCTSSCLRSLEALQSTQQRLCSKHDTLSIQEQAYPVTFTVETLLWTYNFTCYRDQETGEFCAPVFDAWGDGKAPKQSCSDCVLRTFQQQLNFPLYYDDDLASSFTSLTSSCSATNYPVTSPTPVTVPRNTTATVTSTTASATKTCASTYTIKEGDDCHSISRSQNVSLANMLYLNNLEAGCTHFPGAGTKLCMPHQCEIYTVKEDDSCYGITEAYNRTFTMSQLVSWNVDINRGCNNLEILVGHQICVSYPGNATRPSSAVAPAPTMALPTGPCWNFEEGLIDTTCFVTTFQTLPPWTWPGYLTNTTAHRTSTAGASSTPLSPEPSPTTSVHNPPAINPTPSPYLEGMVSGCTDFYAPQDDEPCEEFSERWEVPMKNIIAWNPALKPDCSGVSVGQYLLPANPSFPKV
ncbi:LysM-domain-containing protein [Aspergillus terreus]|uniref:LysM-domain-containing protein n=1 Tax=Aspergillus terreus TaxID=33178 RepID=A0A5M3YVY6_ASPTE|nr:hypothetical protein ATETN484_0005009600 [Aspergillus terreus]GFF16761.1 LysM-domain-containing protein [Aspergillus terreus]